MRAPSQAQGSGAGGVAPSAQPRDRLEAEQDEDGPAIQLTQHVGVDIRDIQDHLDANQGYDPFDALGDLASWLAAYRREHPDLVEKLTKLLDTAAATVGHAR